MQESNRLKKKMFTNYQTIISCWITMCFVLNFLYGFIIWYWFGTTLDKMYNSNLPKFATIKYRFALKIVYNSIEGTIYYAGDSTYT